MSFFCINCKTSTTSSYKACPYCGEPITDFLRVNLEKPIDGKYKILSRLGIGGMGEVYKVLHVHLNTLRVVKLMRPSISDQADSNDRFIREARLATRIQHPNVATLFDFSTLPDGSHYMVWEYIEGVNLGDLLRARGFLSPAYACQIANLVLQGLEAIHRSGVVHRDISPENVMITRNDEGQEIVKIIDLGIAKQSGDDQEEQTKTGTFVGKWKYCSPEQLGLLKAGERIDARADLYSFGIVFYEMLAGRPPFIADSPHQYFVMHSSERVPSFKISNPRAEVPEDLEALVFRALEKDREKRFAGARAFVAAIDALLPHLSKDAPGAVVGDSADLRTIESRGGMPPRKADDETTPEAFLSSHTNDSKTSVSVDDTVPDLDSAEFARTLSDGPQARVETEIEHLPIADRTLIQDVPFLPQQQPLPRRKLSWLAAAAAAGVLLTGGIVSMMRKNVEVPQPAPVAASLAPRPPAGGEIALNAFPWGEVAEIREVGSGRVIPTMGSVTPATFNVSPGTYRIVVRHPEFGEQAETITVDEGGIREVNVQLASAEDAGVPSFVEVPR